MLITYTIEACRKLSPETISKKTKIFGGIVKDTNTGLGAYII